MSSNEEMRSRNDFKDKMSTFDTMTKRIAVIDCGTNTFNLLIADLLPNKPEVIFATKIPVRIGKGGLNDGIILPDAEARALYALQSHKATAEAYEVQQFFCFATSAFRNASNGQQIADRVKKELNIELRIISGIDEAMLIYEGVNAAKALSPQNALIMDIGGGSCEFIYANAQYFHQAHSFEIGVSRLYDKFPMANPPLASEIDRLYQYLENKLEKLFETVPPGGPQFLIGSSGTFDTFKDMHYALHPLQNKNTPLYDLNLDDFRHIYTQICNSSLEERLQIPGMSAFRAEMMVASVVSVDLIMKKYNFNQIRTCTFSMKEGVLYKIWKDTIS